MVNLVVANWKMNPIDKDEALFLAQKIESSAKKNVKAVIAPPFPFLPVIKPILKKVSLGAQNLFWENSGAFTGEVSPLQLKKMGVGYVILGHSERRINLGETYEMVNRKVKAALKSNLRIILCVGESEPEGWGAATIIGTQIKTALRDVKKNSLSRLIIAYEPIWAISTMPGARPDTPQNAFQVSVYIKKILTGLFGRRPADLVQIIYGGSVNPENVGGFLKEGNMEGVLVGGASLNPEKFARILQISSQKK